MNTLSKIKDNPLLSFLIFLLVLAFGAFVGVLLSECIATYVSRLLGLSEKNEALKFLGIGMGGILIALQALMSYKRTKAMEKTANEQAKATGEQAKANLHTEQGQRQDRLKNAIEHLGHKSESVRLGGAYELFHLAKDTNELRQTVLDILCAHIRQTTGESKYRKTHKSKPSEEVQSLLTLLFVQKHEAFKCLRIDLQGSHLNGANLQGARLERAFMNEAYLQKADLSEAHLQEADLSGAHLQMADLCHVHLRGAVLNEASLQWAFLCGARLQGAFICDANLQGANLVEARLEGGFLDNSNLQGSYLLGAHLQGVTLNGADLRGVQFRESRGSTFAESMRNLIGTETEFSHMIFEGGLSQEDVDSLVEGMSDKEANILCIKMSSHIDKPKSNQLPQDSGAIIGSYTAEEAEQWIAEYKKAMPEVSEDDS
ncbi:MAG: pentapeptide repeat-containing protein [Gemmatimonadetes bacterium]|nr:pentapeptide repeat-containing protein [Gemmatimonadota bacterium]